MGEAHTKPRRTRRFSRPRELRRRVRSLGERDPEIINALDFLLTGV